MPGACEHAASGACTLRPLSLGPAGIPASHSSLPNKASIPMSSPAETLPSRDHGLVPVGLACHAGAGAHGLLRPDHCSVCGARFPCTDQRVRGPPGEHPAALSRFFPGPRFLAAAPLLPPRLTGSGYALLLVHRRMCPLPARESSSHSDAMHISAYFLSPNALALHTLSSGRRRRRSSPKQNAPPKNAHCMLS